MKCVVGERERSKRRVGELGGGVRIWDGSGSLLKFFVIRMM